MNQVYDLTIACSNVCECTGGDSPIVLEMRAKNTAIRVLNDGLIM